MSEKPELAVNIRPGMATVTASESLKRMRTNN